MGRRQKKITECGLRNYTISVIGDLAVSCFEYVGDDFESDMAKMEADPVTLEWWKHTKPCFRDHERGVYYEDLEEIFHME